MIKFAVFLAACILPLGVLAHSDGLYYEEQVGSYFVDIGYNLEPTAGDPVRFDLLLSHEKGGEPVPFTQAWVRITGEDGLLFAGPVAYGTFGRPGFSLVFPQGGTYTVSARFEEGEKSLAEVAFPLLILHETKERRKNFMPVYAFMTGALLVYAARLVYQRRNK